MKLFIYQNSESHLNPREWDNLGTIAYKHRSYILGEEKIDDPIEWLEDMLNKDRSYKHNEDRLEELEELFFEQYIALPLYLYDHSGITMKTTPFSCRWDSGKVGYIYVSKEAVRKEYCVKRISAKLRERVLNILEGEIEVFDQCITGDVYGFRVEDSAGKIIDSCCGFFGRNWDTNGIKDHIPKELHPQLEDIDIEY